MAVTAYWSPNQSAIAQVETYTFTAPSSIGNTYNATINGKTVTYTSISGDTAALVATGLFNALVASPIPELGEITFANPSSGVVTATAQTAGTPFANVSGTSAGLVMSTGNGLANGIATTHTQASQSPSDVNDPQNWLRINTAVNPPSKSRALPQNTDDVVLANSATPMLWNLDQLVAVQFNTFTRWLSMTGQIGLLDTNANGYTEWRATYFKFVGPQGSVPAGGLVVVLGYNDGSGQGGPALERYNLGPQKTTLTILSGNTINFLGIHTLNTFTLLGSAVLNIAMAPGEVSTLSSSTVDGQAALGIGPGVTWTAASTLTLLGGSAVMNSAPATITASNGAALTFATDALTWATITLQGGSTMTWHAGGTITTLTMSVNCTLDKSNDARTLTITNSTIDGDTCNIIDPLNAIVWTNATSVKQRVTSGPFQFTGTRTVKVT
jgi:hypothetical protein